MNAQHRLRQLMETRGWSEYKLAKAAGLAQSTVSNIFSRNTMPSLPTLEAICAGLDITMSQFFADGEMFPLSKEQKEFFDSWSTLTKEQKQLVKDLIANFK